MLVATGARLASTRARHGLALRITSARARFSTETLAARLRARVAQHVNNFDAGKQLAPGSLAARLHAIVLANVNQGFLFNVCQLCSLGASLSMEWTAVRCFLIGSSMSWIVFHSSFPAPRPTRMLWSTLFCLMNARSLFLHLAEERDVTLDNAEHRALYEKGFAPHGFTKWQFQQLFARATRRVVGAGEYLFEECEPIDRVTILLEGEFLYAWHKDLDTAMPERLALRRADPDDWARRADEHCTVPIAIPADHAGLYIVTTHGAGVPALHDRQFYPETRASPSTPGTPHQCTDETRAEKQKRWPHLADERGTHRWYASARATAPCVVIELPRRYVHELCEQYPRLATAAANLQIRLLQNQVSHLVRSDSAMIEGKDAEIAEMRKNWKGKLMSILAQ